MFEFKATAEMVMGSGFLVRSPNIIKASLPGHCPLPFRQWPAVGKSLKNHFLPVYFLMNAFLKPSIVSFLYLKSSKPYFFQIFNSQSLKI